MTIHTTGLRERTCSAPGWRNRTNRRARRALAATGLVAIAWAVGSCSSDGGDGNPAGMGGNPISVSGYVLKGSVAGAAVNVRAITANGDVGNIVAGPFTTDADGRWSGEVPGGTAGAHAVTADGGSYTDESTGNTINLTSQMVGIIMVGQNNVGNVTPITYAMFLNGGYRMQLGASKDSAFNGAIGDMTAALGFDPTTVSPGQAESSAPASASTNMDIYTAILAGFSALLDSNPELSPAFDNAETWDIVKAVAADMTDGRLDGIDIVGNNVLVDPDGDGQGTLLPLPPLDANDISNLVDAATEWAAVNLPGVTIPPIDLTTFGNPIITPGGDWDVSGSLTVSGGDAGTFGSSFIPTGVEESVGGVKVDGFTFYRGDLSFFVSVGFDESTPPGTLNIVAAGKTDLLWISMGALPVTGGGISLTGPPYIVSFVEVTLVGLQTYSKTLILNGTLTVTPK